MRHVILILLWVFLSCGNAWGLMTKYDFLLTVEGVTDAPDYIDLDIGDTMSGFFKVDPDVISTYSDGWADNATFDGTVFTTPYWFTDHHFTGFETIDKKLSKIAFYENRIETMIVLDLFQKTFTYRGHKNFTDQYFVIFNYSGSITSPDYYPIPEPGTFVLFGLALTSASIFLSKRKRMFR